MTTGDDDLTPREPESDGSGATEPVAPIHSDIWVPPAARGRAVPPPPPMPPAAPVAPAGPIERELLNL